MPYAHMHITCLHYDVLNNTKYYVVLSMHTILIYELGMLLEE